MVKKGRLFGAAAMLFATLIWGSSFVVMKDTLDDVRPLMLLAARFAIASAVLSLVCIPRFKKLDSATLGHGALMGLLLGSAYILQTYGLVWTTPGKNAFLTTFYVVLVPFMYWATDRKRPDAYNIAAAVLPAIFLLRYIYRLCRKRRWWVCIPDRDPDMSQNRFHFLCQGTPHQGTE